MAAYWKACWRSMFCTYQVNMVMIAHLVALLKLLLYTQATTQLEGKWHMAELAISTWIFVATGPPSTKSDERCALPPQTQCLPKPKYWSRRTKRKQKNRWDDKKFREDCRSTSPETVDGEEGHAAASTKAAKAAAGSMHRMVISHDFSNFFTA